MGAKRLSQICIIRGMFPKQNYNKIAQHTRDAFQLFTRRALAKRLLDVLQRPRAQSMHHQNIQSQLSISLDFDDFSNEIPLTRTQQIRDESLDIRMRTTKHAKPTEHKQVGSVKVYSLRYGDYICLQSRKDGENWRVCSCLDNLKMQPARETEKHIVAFRQCCFQICCPWKELAGRKITNQSMICFKNALNGTYMSLTFEASSSSQFGRSLKLVEGMERDSIFKINQSGSQSIVTDQPVFLSSYYNPHIWVEVAEERLQNKLDCTLMGGCFKTEFRVIRVEEPSNVRGNPFVYVHCQSINQNAEIEEPLFSRFRIEKEVHRIEIDQGNNELKSSVYPPEEAKVFHSITDCTEQTPINIRKVDALSLCQIWQCQRVSSTPKPTLSIRNVISGQQLSSDRESMQSFSWMKKGNQLQLRDCQEGQCLALAGEPVYLTACYDYQAEQYSLRYEQQSQFQSDSPIARHQSFMFSLTYLQPQSAELLGKLLEITWLLRSNYEFIEKWGWNYVERDCRLQVKEEWLHQGLILVRGKMEEVRRGVALLAEMIARDETNTEMIQSMAKQLKLLDLLIIYCKLLKFKAGKGQERVEELAGAQVRPTLEVIFKMVYQLVQNSKVCSQVIIENHNIFNELLISHPQPIGLIIEEAIRNLCILTNKVSKQQDVIFEWTKHVKQLKSIDLLGIQKKYIDIISEVVVDPSDIGIFPYQIKIKEQLLGYRKKIVPKFALQGHHSNLQPVVIFQYDSFPLNTSDNPRRLNSPVPLNSLFQNRQPRPESAGETEYIGSLLKLLRNLCKDRNKKLCKAVEDYGMTPQFMHQLFKNKQISWQFTAKFLDIYCAMYIVQDPFLSFQKGEVKCYAWHKIQHFNFTKKTALLFNQFTEEHLVDEKLKTFDMHVLPLLDLYFAQLQGPNRSSPASFGIIIKLLFEIINHGYLNHRQVQKYLKDILHHAPLILQRLPQQCDRQILLSQIVRLLNLAEEIWVIVQSMHLLRLLYQNLCRSRNTSTDYLRQIFSKALRHSQEGLEADSIREQVHLSQIYKKKRRASAVLTVQRYRQSMEGSEEHPRLDGAVIEFTLRRIIENKLPTNSITLNQLVEFLHNVSQRGERICRFLKEVLILNSPEEENLYLQFSGISPLGVGSQGHSGRRLLDVMKVKELVQKITEQNIEQENESRRKQKILQLKNLLMKITNSLTTLKSTNYRLFAVCQVLLQKLGLHDILIEILRFHDRDHFQSLIEQIILFYMQFVNDQPNNCRIVSNHFHAFTRRYSYFRLPQLLPQLFKENSQQEEAFWMVYRNMDKKMDEEQKGRVFECVYRMLGVAGTTLRQQVRGHVIYTLTSHTQFSKYLRCETVSPSFVKLLCLIGQGSRVCKQRMSQVTPRWYLLEQLTQPGSNYQAKWVFLKIYYFLYVHSTLIDSIECQHLLNRVILVELKRLPPCCQGRASDKVRQLGQGSEMTAIMQDYSSLLIEGQGPVSTSVEEQYLLYIWNTQYEEQISLLMLLSQLLNHCGSVSLEPIANYLHKLIGFMQRIFLKTEKAYQSQILAKLYQLSNIIKQSYRASVPNSHNPTPYSTAYPKVKAFFGQLASLIRREEITYHSLLKTFKVSPKEVEQHRLNGDRSSMVTQTQFTQRLKGLIQLVNVRQQMQEMTSENSIKEFFYLFKQKSTHKLDMVKFASKLVQLLQSERNKGMAKSYESMLSGAEEYRERVRQERQLVNAELLQAQLASLMNVYEMSLRSFMREMVKERLQHMLGSLDVSVIQYRNILQLHLKCGAYPINSIVVQQLLSHRDLGDTLRRVSQRNWNNYFLGIHNALTNTTYPSILPVIILIHQQTHDHPQIHAKIVKFLTQCITLSKSELTSCRDSDQVMQQFHCLMSEVITNRLTTPAQRQTLETMVSEQLILLLVDQPSFSKKASQAFGMLNCLLVCFNDYQSVARVLSESAAFINYLSNSTSSPKALSKFLSVNYNSQRDNRILDLVLRLLIRLATKGFKKQLMVVLSKWRFERVLNTVAQLHTFLTQSKQYDMCLRQKQRCSPQFCNDGKMTPHDLQIRDMACNITILLHVAGQILPEDDISQLQEADKNVITVFKDWHLGKPPQLQYEHLKYLQIMRKISIKISDEQQTVYFTLPSLHQFTSSSIENQVISELQSAKKQDLFGSLYHLSFHVQQQLQQQRDIDEHFLARHFFPHLYHIHFVIIFYLTLVVVNMLFGFVEIPPGITYTINTIIVFVKVSVIGLQARRQYRTLSLLQQVHGQKPSLVRLIPVIIQVLILFSYLTTYAVPEVVSLSLFFELVQLKSAYNILSVSMQSLKVLIVLLLYCQTLFILCAFIVQMRTHPPSGSLFGDYFQLLEQTMLFHHIPFKFEHVEYYTAFSKVPEFIPFLSVSILLFSSLFLALNLKELARLSAIAQSRRKKCQLCGLTRDQCQGKGRDYKHHVNQQHSIWNYIYYFIHLRQKKQLEMQDQAVLDMLDKQDYRFLIAI